MKKRLRNPALASTTALLLAFILAGCSREREISGQIFIVTEGGNSVKLGLVGVHVLTEEELKTLAGNLFAPQSESSNLALPRRLFAILPPPVVKTDADGQFTLRAKRHSWLFASAVRKEGRNDKTYLWAFSVEELPAKVLLSNDNNLMDKTSLGMLATLAKMPGLAQVSALESEFQRIQFAAWRVTVAAEEKAAADRIVAESKPAAEMRLAWTGAAMRRAGFQENVITRTLTQGGTVVAWGHNHVGEARVPAGLTGVTAIAAGNSHTVALKSDGTVVLWGFNICSYRDREAIADLSGVVAIAAGSYHGVALKIDGTVVAWGYSEDGQTKVPAGLKGVTAIAAGAWHNVALKNDGTVVAWGRNVEGQRTVPSGLSGVTAIAAGGVHTVALKSDGTVVAWGNNECGQARVPAGLSGVTAIAGAAMLTVALKSNGTVVEWGATKFRSTTIPAGLGGVVAIAASGEHTVALKANGTVVAWGKNDKGQATVPAGLNSVVAIAAGNEHTVALRLE